MQLTSQIYVAGSNRICIHGEKCAHSLKSMRQTHWDSLGLFRVSLGLIGTLSSFIGTHLGLIRVSLETHWVSFGTHSGFIGNSLGSHWDSIRVSLGTHWSLFAFHWDSLELIRVSLGLIGTHSRFIGTHWDSFEFHWKFIGSHSSFIGNSLELIGTLLRFIGSHWDSFEFHWGLIGAHLRFIGNSLGLFRVSLGLIRVSLGLIGTHWDSFRVSLETHWKLIGSHWVSLGPIRGSLGPIYVSIGIFIGTHSHFHWKLIRASLGKLIQVSLGPGPSIIIAIFEQSLQKCVVEPSIGSLESV